MRIEHLEEFLDLAGTLNFTQTAKHFFITQPVLSKHIASLEQEFGGKLFERDKGAVSLTPLGNLLLPGAQMLVGDKNRLLSDAAQYLSNESARLKVGYLTGAAAKHIPSIQRQFSEMYPDVKVEYFTYEFDKIFEYLNNSEVDMIIGGLALALSDDQYVIYEVYEDTYYALVRSDDPLTALPEITAADLAGKTVIVPAPSFFGRDTEALNEWLEPRKNGISVVESVHDINAAPLTVAMGDCAALSFGHLAAYYGTDYTLIPLKGFDATLNIAVIWRRSAEKPFFRDFARITHDVIRSTGY